MSLISHMYCKYKFRDDKDNIFGVGIDDTTMISYLIDYLLGEDWIVTDPVGHNQLNEIALYDILNKYSPKYRKEYKKWKKLLKKRDKLNNQFEKHFNLNIPAKQN